MRALIQRVTRASVTIEGEKTAEIGRGLLVLLGVGRADTETELDLLWRKLANLRIFQDEQDKTNLDLAQIDGALLIVSQFTLYADCRKGNRPSFTSASTPDEGERLYRLFIERAKSRFETVREGKFGAMMQVELVNDGPFTIWLDTDDLKRSKRN